MTFSDIIIYSTIFLGLYTAIVYFLTLLENREVINRKKNSLLKRYPKVAIIVPCFNEEKNISQTITSLIGLNYPKNKLEIIIVDDGSTDSTYQKAKLFEKYEFVRVFHKENGGKFSALNYGIKKTKAKFVGCLDADSFVEPDSLKKVMAYFDKPKVMAVTASLKVYQPKGILPLFQKAEYLLNIFLRKILAFLNSIYITPGPLSIFRKEVFNEVGYYKYAHGTEDLEICLRIQKHNYIIENAPNANVYTVVPSSFKGLFNQRIRWYHGFLRNIWDYRFLIGNIKYGDLSFFVLPISVFSILFLLINMIQLSIQLSRFLITQFIDLNAIGFDLTASFNHLSFPKINFFTFNIETSTFLVFLLVFIPIIFIIIGKKISNEKSNLKLGILIEILLYPFLYTIWWLGAFYKAILREKVKWMK